MSKAELFVVVETDTKSKNIGASLRCAVAFGASSICIYGYKEYSTHGAKGAQTHIPVLHFYYLKDCLAFLRERGCKVYSISASASIHSSSIDITNCRFSSSAAFILASGSEFRMALSREKCEAADKILHCSLPQPVFEAGLHYNAKLSICLQEYAMQMNFEALPYAGEKHVIEASSNGLETRVEIDYKRHVREQLQQQRSIADAVHCDAEDLDLADLFGL